MSNGPEGDIGRAKEWGEQRARRASVLYRVRIGHTGEYAGKRSYTRHGVAAPALAQFTFPPALRAGLVRPRVSLLSPHLPR